MDNNITVNDVSYSFEEIDITNDQHLGCLVSWFNDPQLSQMVCRQTDQLGSLTYDAQEIQRFWNNGDGIFAYFIILDHHRIGYIKAVINSKNSITETTKKLAWLSLVIADPKLQHRGVGGASLAWIENLLLKNNIKMVEVGVFAHNTKALLFFKKNGYKQFDTIEKMTYVDQMWLDDLRFIKNLAAD